jgi:hypothetical protein
MRKPIAVINTTLNDQHNPAMSLTIPGTGRVEQY